MTRHDTYRALIRLKKTSAPLMDQTTEERFLGGMKFSAQVPELQFHLKIHSSLKHELLIQKKFLALPLHFINFIRLFNYIYPLLLALNLSSFLTALKCIIFWFKCVFDAHLQLLDIICLFNISYARTIASVNGYMPFRASMVHKRCG